MASFLRELRTFLWDLLGEMQALRPDVPSGLQLQFRPGSLCVHGEMLVVCMCLGVQTDTHSQSIILDTVKVQTQMWMSSADAVFFTLI